MENRSNDWNDGFAAGLQAAMEKMLQVIDWEEAHKDEPDAISSDYRKDYVGEYSNAIDEFKCIIQELDQICKSDKDRVLMQTDIKDIKIMNDHNYHRCCEISFANLKRNHQNLINLGQFASGFATTMQHRSLSISSTSTEELEVVLRVLKREFDESVSSSYRQIKQLWIDALEKELAERYRKQYSETEEDRIKAGVWTRRNGDREYLSEMDDKEIARRMKDLQRDLDNDKNLSFAGRKIKKLWLERFMEEQRDRIKFEKAIRAMRVSTQSVGTK